MTDKPGSAPPVPSLDSQIEAVCVRFEDAWKAGRRPALEHYLGDPPPAGRAALLSELLKLDVYYRRRQGEQPTPGEYRTRFPNDADLLERVVGTTAGANATIDDPVPSASGRPTTGGPRYVPVRFHAKGGLGEVHVARDAELRRDVALKRIQGRWAGDAESRRRFLAEAEITGRLEHPGVVPVYGLVRGEDGEPCYAMRFIDGETLEAAVRRLHAGDGADESGLALRQLLARFVTVCNTLAYAHSRGIVHRDLKPANVLLGKYGETLVVDWGLAKPFVPDGEAGADTAAAESVPDSATAAETGEDAIVTRTGAAVGTPAYMSPEQARGDRDQMSPASDVFGLGAILYAVLTGHAPYEDCGRDEAIQRASRAAFTPPRSIRRAVPPALEAVTLKAMATEPADRYPSALALATDVERWLADEPVAAHREPPGVRLRRWMRKHPRLVTGVVATLAVGLAAVGVVAWQRERARQSVAAKEAETARERDTAREQKRRTRAALDTMVSQEMIERLGSQKELSKQQREFLQTALNYYKEFATEAGADQEGRWLEAQARFRVGYLLQALGQIDEAVSAFRAALPIYDGLAADYRAEQRYRGGLATTHTNVGILLFRLGRWTEADADCRAALAELEKLVAEFPDAVEFRRNLTYAQINLGSVYQSWGRLSDAEAIFRSGVAESEKLSRDYPNVAQYRGRLAASQAGLGSVLDELGRPAEAEAAHRAALVLLTKLTGDAAAEPAFRRDLGKCHVNLGKVLLNVGQLVKAEATFRSGLAVFQKLADEFPAVPDYRDGCATCHFNLGLLFVGSGRLSDAEAAYRASLSAREKLAADFPGEPDFRRELAGSHNNLAALLNSLHRLAEAVASCRAAKAIQEKLAADFPTVPTYRLDLAGSHHNLGNLLGDLGRFEEAEAAYCAELAVLKKLTADYPNVPKYREQLDIGALGLGAVLVHEGRALEAVKAIESIADSRSASAQSLYECAPIYAIASAARPSAALAAKAVATLRRAFAAGYPDATQIAGDDFAALRGRDDYADLLWDLADAPAQTPRQPGTVR